MPNETYYSVQIIRVLDIQTSNAAFCVEVELNGVTRKTGTLNNEGIPKNNDIVTFARSDDSENQLIFRLKRPSRIVGQVTIDANGPFRDLAGNEVRQEIHFLDRFLAQTGSEMSGDIHFCLKTVDAQTRAGIELTSAEKSIKHVESLAETTGSSDEAIGTFVDVADAIIDIVDDVVQIHPILKLSWQAVTALYKLAKHQLDKNTKLVYMVKTMQEILEFSREVNELETRSDALRLIVKKLLRTIVECSRFVQKYAKKRLVAQMTDIKVSRNIEEYMACFVKLKGELDSAITFSASKQIDDIKQKQQLEALLGPVKSDASNMSSRPRCLQGTRQEYLDPIMEFLNDTTSPNVLWLTGAAGSGKSTIAFTVYDRCGAKGYRPAYVFFEREKSDPNTVIRTIAYTVASFHPSIARSIIKVLEKNPTIPGSTLSNQFLRLLLEPLAAAEIASPIVIILDALDECGSRKQRHDLLKVLTTSFVGLSSKVRVLVTSRPEGDIMDALQRTTRIRTVELKPDSNESRRDVDLYIRRKMADALGIESRGVAWNGMLQALCDAADGLFIWASTAVETVQNAVNKKRVLQRLASDVRTVGRSGSDDGFSLDELYATTLKESRIWGQDSKDEGSAILGLILFAKETMLATVIEAFLGLEEDTVDAVLKRLRSVVSYEPGKPVRLRHASFADYLLSYERSGGNPWHIDETRAKKNITECCFEVMAKILRFNICGIGSSFLPNSELRELKERIASEIQPHLNYACRFWSAHMCELEVRDDLDDVRDKLRRFAKEQLLYWLEVLSLTGSFSQVAGRALREAGSWIMTVDAELSSFLTSGYSLVTVFAPPISQSAPHIYLSAISLWKEKSLVAEHYSKAHPVVKVRTMGAKTRSQCIKVLETKGALHSMAVSRDETLVASSSKDRRIRVWDVDNSALISDFEMDEGGNGGVREEVDVAFSPDNKYIVSLLKKGTLSVWNLGSRKQISACSVGVSGRADTSVAFSPDAQRVIAIYNESAHALDFNDGKLELVPDWFDADADVKFRYVSRDGKYVVGRKDDNIAVWDSDTGKQISGWIDDFGDQIAVSSDGKRVAVNSESGVSIWSVDSGHLVASSDKVHNVESVAFFPDGNRIVAGYGLGYIAVLDADSGDVIIWSLLEGYGHGVNSVYATLDGKRVISASKYEIRIWDVDSMDGEVTSGSSVHTADVRSVAFSSDGKHVVSGSDDDTIRIWDADSGELLKGPFKGHESSVESVAFSPDGQRVVSGSNDGTVRIWDANSGKQLSSLVGHTDSVWSVAFSADGKRIASGSGDNTVRIWDAHTGELIKGPFNAHRSAVSSVSFSPDGKRVVSGSWDETVRIWDVQTANLLRTLVGHSDSVSSVAFSPDGKRVASGSIDATIRIWNADSGEPVSGPIKGHTKGITSISFSPNGRRIASGSWDSTLRIWDVGSGELVLGPSEGHTSSVESVSFSPCGNRVVSSSWDETIRVWDVSSDHTATRCSEKSSADALAFSSSSPFTDTNTEPCAERTFSDWKLHEDGWVKGQQGELLIWIPEDMRETLWRPRNIAVFNCEFSTKLDFTSSPIGEKWAKGYPLRNRD